MIVTMFRHMTKYNSMRQVSTLYKALSDPNRLRILMMLQQASRCVCELVAVLELAPSTVSKHLSILRNADLILDEKDGRWVNYRLTTVTEAAHVKPVLEQLNLLLAEDETVRNDQRLSSAVNRHHICGR